MSVSSIDEINNFSLEETPSAAIGELRSPRGQPVVARLDGCTRPRTRLGTEPVWPAAQHVARSPGHPTDTSQGLAANHASPPLANRAAAAANDQDPQPERRAQQRAAEGIGMVTHFAHRTSLESSLFLPAQEVRLHWSTRPQSADRALAPQAMLEAGFSVSLAPPG
jgi:hypothetical protein